MKPLDKFIPNTQFYKRAAVGNGCCSTLTDVTKIKGYALCGNLKERQVKKKMIDFDETGLYKSFVKNQKGKKFPGRNPQLLTLSEVENADSFSGVMYPNTVLIDADEEPYNEILQKIITGEELACYVTDREGGRGVHALMINSNTALKKADKVMLACGIVVDFHPGYSLPYECLKFNGTERRSVYNKQPYQELPKYFTPLPKCNIDFASMGEGDGRNSTLFSYILTLQNAGLDTEDIRETIRIINKYVLKEPLLDEELEVILRDDAFQKPVFFLGSTFLFDKFANYMINNHHIVKINGQLHIYKEGVYFGDSNSIAGIMRSYIPNIKKSQKTEVFDYMYDMAEEKEQSDANLIAFNNGVYDLVSGELKPFSTDIVITNKIPWDYKADAYCELADNTLNKLACDDPAIRSLLEECIGYCFYRSNSFNRAFILTGDKSNGKSTFLKVLTVLLGEYNVASLDLKNLGDRFSKASLFGKLANIGDDISDEFVSDASLFKKITDGGRIQVEKKGQDPFEFNPYVKLIFSANNMPRIKDKTGAVLRRLVIIPFNATFSESDAGYDPFIKYKLIQQDSIEYLIKVGIAGLQRVVKNNHFTESKKVQKEIEEYEDFNNPVKGFFKECTEQDGEDYIFRETATSIYKRYQVYCAENNFQPESNTVFGRTLKSLFGVESKQKKISGKNVRMYVKVAESSE